MVVDVLTDRSVRWPTLKSTAPIAQVSFSDETAVPVDRPLHCDEIVRLVYAPASRVRFVLEPGYGGLPFCELF
jgi:hypothetical protein